MPFQNRLLSWAVKARDSIRQPHVLPIFCSIVFGPLIGLMAHEVSQSAGRIQYVVTFTAGTLLVGLVVSFLQRRSSGLVLCDVTLSIPKFSTLKFVVNNEHKRVAWILFVETASRIATQPMAPTDGILREALSSLHGLFETCREALKTMDPNQSGSRASVEFFALTMLNNELRPFLSKWHPILTAFESQELDKSENDWPRAQECRAELESLRSRILEYSHGFGHLAGIKGVDDFFSDSSSIADCDSK